MRHHKNKYPEACVTSGGAANDMSAGACRALWRAVLAQAVDEATRAFFAVPEIEAHRARSWFGTRDFRMVCDLAGLDARAVYDAFQSRLAARQGGSA